MGLILSYGIFNFGAVGRAYPVDIFQVELSESHKAI